jgi:hypothetical protein
MAKAENDPRQAKARKQLTKVFGLFDKHEFWSTQPVQNVYDLVEANDFNRPVEVKEVSDIDTECLKLPEQYYWSNVDLSDET